MIAPTDAPSVASRKLFAWRIYLRSDLITTPRLMGHTNPVTTARYLETDSVELHRFVRSVGA